MDFGRDVAVEIEVEILLHGGDASLDRLALHNHTHTEVSGAWGAVSSGCDLRSSRCSRGSPRSHSSWLPAPICPWPQRGDGRRRPTRMYSCVSPRIRMHVVVKVRRWHEPGNGQQCDHVHNRLEAARPGRGRVSYAETGGATSQTDLPGRMYLALYLCRN